MCHSLPGIEESQDDPYENIQSQRQLGTFSQGGGCKKYNEYNFSVVTVATYRQSRERFLEEAVAHRGAL
jgi:hypothetical protein